MAPELLRGLSSLVWDGKIYKRDPAYDGGPWNGPHEMIPMTVLSDTISLSHFLVPAEALTVGPHTLAIKDDCVQSNAITVCISAKIHLSSTGVGPWFWLPPELSELFAMRK